MCHRGEKGVRGLEKRGRRRWEEEEKGTTGWFASVKEDAAERPSFEVNKVNKERGSDKESKRIGSGKKSEREQRMILRTLIRCRADNQAE